MKQRLKKNAWKILFAFLAIITIIYVVCAKGKEATSIVYADISPDGHRLAIIRGNRLMITTIGNRANIVIARGPFYTCRWGGSDVLWFDKLEFNKAEIGFSIWKWDRGKDEIKLVVKRGSQPCPSPDGRWLAYRIEPQSWALGQGFINAIYMLKEKDIKGGIGICDYTGKVRKTFEQQSLLATHTFTLDGKSVLGIFSITLSELKDLDKEIKARKISDDEYRTHSSAGRLVAIKGFSSSSTEVTVDRGDFLYSLPLLNPHINDPCVLKDGGIVVGKQEKEFIQLYKYRKEGISWRKEALWSERIYKGFSGFTISDDGQFLLALYSILKPASIISILLLRPRVKEERLIRLINLNTKKEIMLYNLKNKEKILRLAYSPALNCFYLVLSDKILAIDKSGRKWVLWTP